jgi:superfamily II DNA or RNA helicase
VPALRMSIKNNVSKFHKDVQEHFKSDVASDLSENHKEEGNWYAYQKEQLEKMYANQVK